MALKPSLHDPHNNRARRVDRALGLADFRHRLYTTQVPVWDLIKQQRTLVNMPFHLPHMVISKQVETGKLLKGSAALRSCIAFRNHSVTLQHGADATIPAGMFIDGTDWAHDGNSILVYYCNWSGQPMRHVITLIDKWQMCQCGCGGNCTTSAVDDVVRWAFAIMAEGQHPTCRHDGTAFPSDSCFSALAGKPLGAHVALIHLRLDMVSVWDHFGFHRWNTKFPCYLCHATKANMFDEHATWNRVCHEAYREEVRRCLAQGSFAGARFKKHNPIMDIPGLRIEHLAIDRLHTLDLGVTAAYNGTTLWRLMELLGPTTEAALAQLNRLWRSMRNPKARTWIKQLRLKHIGAKDKGFCKFGMSGASKNRVLLPFVVRLVRGQCEELDRRGLHGTRLLITGRALLKVYRLLSLAKRPQGVTGALQHKLVEMAKTALRCWKLSGGHMYPRHHYFMHLCGQVADLGAETSTDMDESFNKVVKRVYRSCRSTKQALAKLWLYDHAHSVIRHD